MAVSTYNAIASVTLTSAQPQVTFSNIPQTYTDLVLVMSYRSTRTNTYAYPKMTLNGDASSNYSITEMYASGSAAYSGRANNQTGFALVEGVGNTATAGIFGQFNISLQNYSNNTTFKTILSRAGAPISGNSSGAGIGLYRKTSAITSITIADNNALDIMIGSTFSLYGVGANQLKASGGDIIVSDGTYWYHAFKSSGTFTPNSALSCEALVIAGGGGGGGEIPGGGGAGGLRYASGLSISTATSVTVGAGGAGSLGSAGTDIGASGGDSVFSTITSSGGGGGAGSANNGAAGGSGGGAWAGGGTGGAASPVTSPVQGYAGGNGGAGYPGYGGGGGGAGGVGAAGGTTEGTSGKGGIGVSTYSTWGLITGTGSNHSAVIYFAGGGGGGTWNGGPDYKGGAGGFGGGGSGWGGTADAGTGGAGASNTGGGGGGGGNSANSIGGAGGSGLVIVRYAV
jgi:hypothetical protein